ncbi:MAG: hypothetical protein ACM3ZF_13150 [Mycobacterium leprae]
MTDQSTALRTQLATQVAHWRAATLTLDDPESFATAAAWEGLEQYLGLTLRRHLAGVVDRLKREADLLGAQARTARGEAELERLRHGILALKRRFTQTETVLDFYGDAVNTRTSPRLAALLSTCDVLAAQSMTAVLRPLGHPVPPVLTYVDKGLGASILRAGLRLWDPGALSPVAAIKCVRHNLLYPTALLHEAGHQAAYLTGWTDELAAAFDRDLGAGSVGPAWADWASEVSADVFAFAHTGYAVVAGLHEVLVGETPSVFRYPLGDPHPIPYLRVLFGVQMCRSTFGSGPWDDLGRFWVRTYPLEEAPVPTRDLIDRSVELLPRLAELCLRTPMRAFAGRPLVALVDPTNVRPDRLAGLEAAVRRGQNRSTYWLWQECVRLLALAGYQAATAPEQAAAIATAQEDWMIRLGQSTRAAA